MLNMKPWSSGVQKKKKKSPGHYKKKKKPTLLIQFHLAARFAHFQVAYLLG